MQENKKIFTELIRSIEKIHAEVIELIGANVKAAVNQAEGRMKKLEQEIAVLSKRNAELKQLSETEDHIHFLQNFQSLCAPPEAGDLPSVTVNTDVSFEAMRKAVSELKDHIENFCKGELVKITTTGCACSSSTSALRSIVPCSDTTCGKVVNKGNRNTMLAEVVEKLKQTGLNPPPAQSYAGPGDVPCDFCTGRKFKAVKSCLTCLASYCETHVKPHYEGAAFKRHKLINAIGNLQQKLCAEYQKVLEVFCRTDQTCICLLCSDQEHKSHDTVSAETERTGKQARV
ncbi:UNVERIFIED_CONTAM: hypothetical protein FKN15_067244 [Acipenser sinensis]